MPCASKPLQHGEQHDQDLREQNTGIECPIRLTPVSTLSMVRPFCPVAATASAMPISEARISDGSIEDQCDTGSIRISSSLRLAIDEGETEIALKPRLIQKMPELHGKALVSPKS